MNDERATGAAAVVSSSFSSSSCRCCCFDDAATLDCGGDDLTACIAVLLLRLKYTSGLGGKEARAVAECGRARAVPAAVVLVAARLALLGAGICGAGRGDSASSDRADCECECEWCWCWCWCARLMGADDESVDDDDDCIMACSKMLSMSASRCANLLCSLRRGEVAAAAAG